MNTDLRNFVTRYLQTVLFALAPVIFTAFVSMPMTLNRHPGELARVDAPLQHMT